MHQAEEPQTFDSLYLEIKANPRIKQVVFCCWTPRVPAQMEYCLLKRKTKSCWSIMVPCKASRSAMDSRDGKHHLLHTRRPQQWLRCSSKASSTHTGRATDETDWKRLHHKKSLEELDEGVAVFLIVLSVIATFLSILFLPNDMQYVLTPEPHCSQLLPSKSYKLCNWC